MPLHWKSGERSILPPPSRRSRVARKLFMSLPTRSSLPTVFVSTPWRWARVCRRCPIIGSTLNRQFVEPGGLVSYGPVYVELWRRAAEYVDKILRGAKPGDIPVEQPTKFELVVNLTTAKALGLTIPESFLARADEVIE